MYNVARKLIIKRNHPLIRLLHAMCRLSTLSKIKIQTNRIQSEILFFAIPVFTENDVMPLATQVSNQVNARFVRLQVEPADVLSKINHVIADQQFFAQIGNFLR